MKYMGSKARIAKHLLPIILKDRKPDQWYVEPFVGGGNMIDKVEGNRIGSDSNKWLILALKLIQMEPESIPDIITETDYSSAKTLKKEDGITGFIGFAMSFGGKWFAGYRRDKAGSKGCIKNMETQTKRAKKSAVLQSRNISGVNFLCCTYDHLEIPKDSIVYCDPPYQGTTKYKDGFNHDDFWQWCREKAGEGHKVFISEYSAPDDFVCVWSGQLKVSVAKSGRQKDAMERLFVHKSQVPA